MEKSKDAIVIFYFYFLYCSLTVIYFLEVNISTSPAVSRMFIKEPVSCLPSSKLAQLRHRIVK